MANPLTPEDNEELEKVRMRLLQNRLKDKANNTHVTFKDDQGDFTQGAAGSYLESDPNKGVLVSDEEGAPVDSTVLKMLMNGQSPFDPSLLEQKDPIVAQNRNTVNLVDGEWYQLDDAGDSYHIDDGEAGAMALMRDGAKPGLGVMSARRIALQRAKENAPDIDWRDEFPMPTLGPGKTRQFAARVLEDEEPNESEPTEDEEMRKMQARTTTK